LKIAMFADSFYPTVDGAVVAMDTLSRGLEARGHEIVVFAPKPKTPPDTRWRVHYLPSVEFKSYPGYRVVISPSDMLERMRAEKVDLIHCHGLAAMAILSLTASRALRIPHVLTFHTMAHEAIRYYTPLRLQEELMSSLVWTYLRNLLKRPEAVVVPSAPIKEELISWGVRMKHCLVVPTGVDCSRFRPDNYDIEFLHRYGLQGKKVVLHVGRLSKEKRLDIALGAVKELSGTDPHLRLLVVGGGPALEHYKDMVRDLGISDRVVFTGFLPDRDLEVAYATCDMLVISSTFETQGLVVLEAMASGRPVAGMRARAIPEFVQEGKNGCLFDEDSCAEAIMRCLSRAESMRISALATAREYSVDACTARLEGAYETAITEACSQSVGGGPVK
jgi:1,2-diacylglycerol 3-alpha-glucosyltransferase